jgi:hypothetical protein
VFSRSQTVRVWGVGVGWSTQLPVTASAYRSVATVAEELADQTLDWESAKELAFAVPEGPDWLNPKYLDAFDGAMEPWQNEVADLQTAARRTAVELRSLATYGRT